MHKNAWIWALCLILLAFTATGAFAADLTKAQAAQQELEQQRAIKLANSPVMGKLAGTPTGRTTWNELDEEFDLLGPVTFDDMTGWTVVDYNEDGNTWTNSNDVAAPRTYDYLNDTAPIMYVDSDDVGSGITMEERLVSPSFSTVGMFAVTLTFDSRYNRLSSDIGSVEVSTDGGATWETAVQFTADHTGLQTVDLTAWAGNADVMISFYYNDLGSWAWYWAIDNVYVVGNDTDVFGPGISNVSAPGDVVTGVDATISATITDATGVGSATLSYLEWDNVNSVPVEGGISGSVAMTADGDTYTGVIPGDAGWMNDMYVAWNIDAEDTIDPANTSRYPADAGTYMTFTVSDDETAPAISYVHSPGYQTPEMAGDFMFNITDGSGVAGATVELVEYDISTNLPVEGGATASVTLTDMGDGLFTGSVAAGTFAPGVYVGWYVSATDTWEPANEGRFPSTADTYYPYPVVGTPFSVDDFELDDGTWVSTDGDLRDPPQLAWEHGVPVPADEGPMYAQSGDNVWASVLDADYHTSENGYLTNVNTYTLGAGAQAVFAQWFYSEGNYDGHNFQVSSDGGTTWAVVPPTVGYPDPDVSGLSDDPAVPDVTIEPGFSRKFGTWGYDMGGIWHGVVFDLSAYAGMDVMFRFRFGSDSSVQYWGAALDNFALYGVLNSHIFGTVTDSDTEAPLGGATIEVYEGETLYATAESAEDGTFSILAAPGTYSATATLTGYQQGVMNDIVVTDGADTQADFALIPETEVVTVTGTVMSADTEGLPVSGVAITIVGAGASGFSGADGTFSLATEVPAGFYTVYMTHNPVGSAGYHDVTLTNVEIRGTTVPLTLYMPEILAPTITTVESMDAGVSVEFDPPANHAEPPALVRGIEFRQNTIALLEGATDEKSVRVRNEMASELVVLQRRLDMVQNGTSLDEITDFAGYRFMLNGELLPDVAEGSPYMITGLTNGTLYQVQVAADYEYNEAFLEWSEASPAYPTPSGLYAVEETDYVWVDIRPSEGGSGTGLNLTDDGESAFLPMPDGWSFTHYGVAYTQFSVSPNGWISFIHNNGGLSGTIPSPNDPDATIAPYWRDQDPGDSDTEDAWYWFDEENELVYVQWSVGNFPGPANNVKDYEVVLDINTATTYIYYNTSASGWASDTGVTIGVENAEGTVGLTYPHANIVDSHGIMFFPLQINYGTLVGTITDATTENPIEGALVNAISASGAEYSGASDVNGFYQVRLVDQDDGPWDLEFRATGYENASIEAVDFVEGDGYTHTEDIALDPIDPTTPPNIIGSNGSYDDGVGLTLSEPGSLLEAEYIQLDDGTINNAVGWNGTQVGYWYATRFTVPGEGVILLASDLRFLTFEDLQVWWPAGDETHQPVQIAVFGDDGGFPGEMLWSSENITPEDPTPLVEVAPNIPVPSTFYIGFHNMTPEAGQEPLCVDNTNDHAALVLSTNDGDTWSASTNGDPLVRASVLYAPSGGVPTTAVVTPAGIQETKQADVSINLVSQLPVWGLHSAGFEGPHPRFNLTSELDEFLGYNVEYSVNGTDWTVSNTELIEGNLYFVMLGSENENTEYSFRANAVVTDPEGGDDITSNYSEVTMATFNMPPAPPTEFTGDNDGLTVSFDWTAPTMNADGTELIDLDGYSVWVVSGTEPTLLGSTDSETTTFSTDMEEGGFYAFAVTAHDEVPNESAISTPVVMLVGSPGLATSFETGEFNEMESDGVWEHGTPTAGPGAAHSGDNVWATLLGSNYDNSQNNFVSMTAPFQVNTDAALAAYWHWVNYETGWDGYNVKISTDEGVTWDVIEPVGGYPDDSIFAFGEPGFTGTNGGWQLVMFELNGYNGTTIQLQWQHGTDGSVNGYYGVAIDDLELYGVVPPAYGTASGILHDCAEDGPPVIGAEIWADGRMMGTSGADGSFSVEMLAGMHTIEFHHDNFWTLVYEDQMIPEDDDLAMGDMIMTKPDPAVDPTTLSMDININDQDPVSSTFELANDGCGPMEFSASVNILNGANEIVGSYPENVLPGDITEVEDLPYYQATKQSAANRGPVAVSELDETWDLLQTFDADAISGAQDNLSAWIDGSSGYIMQFNAPYNIYEFDFSGTLLETHTPSTGGAQWWNEIEYDPTTGLVMTAAASGAIYQFMPDGSNATNIGSCGQDAWGLAYDYDNGIVYWSNAFEQSAWGMLNLSTSQNTTLSEPGPGGYPWAMMYVPNDPNGNTIYGAFSDSPSAGPVGIYGYNPSTMAWTAAPIVTLYGDGSNAVVGMTGTTDWSGALDFVTFTQGTGADLVDIYEGMTLQSWLYVDPGTGILLPGESANITVTVDLAADPSFQPVHGQNVTAQVVITGPHMVDTAVTVDMVFLDAEESDNLMPAKYALHQNYPNPFNPSTSIKFDLVASQNVKLTVYNMLGQEVARLVDGQMQAGYHNVSFDASRLASGVYFYRLETPAFTKMKKMVLVK